MTEVHSTEYWSNTKFENLPGGQHCLGGGGVAMVAVTTAIDGKTVVNSPRVFAYNIVVLCSRTRSHYYSNASAVPSTSPTKRLYSPASSTCHRWCVVCDSYFVRNNHRRAVRRSVGHLLIIGVC